MPNNQLLLIDGNALLHRAFFALPKTITSPAGVPINAVYGTMRQLCSIIPTIKPSHLAVCLDASKQETFRKKHYPEYKANRKETPQELVPQFKIFREVLVSLNIPYFEDPEYEADDLLGTIAEKAVDYQTLILTGDHDMLQLINQQVNVMLIKSSRQIILTKENLQNEMGYTPDMVVEIKALAGDTSDNIPGVPGVGEKTAIKLLKKYGSVKEIIANADSITGKLGANIRNNIDLIRLSYFLSTIKCDCPITDDIDSFRMNIDMDNGLKKMAELGIKKIDLGKLLIHKI